MTIRVLAEELAKKLIKRKETLALAESCTGGLIAHALTNIPGSSTWFECGVITYSNASKSGLLKIKDTFIKKYGSVSAQVVQAMAEEVRRMSGTSYGLATSGIAGPTGGTKDTPLGTLFVAVATPKETKVQRYHFPEPRVRFKERAAEAALQLLIQYL